MADLPILSPALAGSAKSSPRPETIKGPFATKTATPACSLFGLTIWKRPRPVKFCNRYLVKARVKDGRTAALAKAMADRTLGRESIAGDEYLHDMQMARANAKGEAHWVETCFCDPPLEEERPYWEKYFDLLSVKDAHSRRNCRHENGNAPWACCDCDCTERLEERLASRGKIVFAKADGNAVAPPPNRHPERREGAARP